MRVSVTGTLLPLIFAVVISPGSFVHAQTYPACEYAASDSNGDGYGWEDRQSCVVTEDSSPGALPIQCADDDGDGWGWNGSQVCRVKLDCVDTAPIGDGWGWDGTKSCEIPAYLAPFSELETLKQNSQLQSDFGAEISTAVLNCSFSVVSVRYLIRASGRVTRKTDNSTKTGYWSTGFSDNDGLIHLHSLPGSSWIVLTPTTIKLRGRSGSEESSDCFWE